MSIMVLPQIGGILVSISEVMTRIDLSDRSGKPVVSTKERNRFEKRDVPSGGGGVARIAVIEVLGVVATLS